MLNRRYLVIIKNYKGESVPVFKFSVLSAFLVEGENQQDALKGMGFKNVKNGYVVYFADIFASEEFLFEGKRVRLYQLDEADLHRYIEQLLVSLVKTRHFEI